MPQLWILLFVSGAPDMLFTILHQLAALQAPAVKKKGIDAAEVAHTKKQGRSAKDRLIAAGDANA